MIHIFNTQDFFKEPQHLNLQMIYDKPDISITPFEFYDDFICLKILHTRSQS